VLHAAVRKKDVDIAKLLVEFGCPVDVQNVTTETAMSCFYFQPIKIPIYLILGLLFSRQAEGQTALHIAAYEGDEAMIKFLQTTRVDANIADSVSIGCCAFMRNKIGRKWPGDCAFSFINQREIKEIPEGPLRRQNIQSTNQNREQRRATLWQGRESVTVAKRGKNCDLC